MIINAHINIVYHNMPHSWRLWQHISTLPFILKLLKTMAFWSQWVPLWGGPSGPRYFAKLVDLCVNTPNALLVSDMALECPGSMVSSNGMDQRWDEETCCENMWKPGFLGFNMDMGRIKRHDSMAVCKILCKIWRFLIYLFKAFMLWHFWGFQETKGLKKASPRRFMRRWQHLFKADAGRTLPDFPGQLNFERLTYQAYKGLPPSYKLLIHAYSIL